jgi:formylglycine-generating enzyme required for sulfatase activity
MAKQVMDSRVAELNGLIRFYEGRQEEIALHLKEALAEFPNPSEEDQGYIEGLKRTNNIVDARKALAVESLAVLVEQDRKREPVYRFKDDDVQWRHDRLSSLVKAMEGLAGGEKTEVHRRREGGSSSPEANKMREVNMEIRLTPPPPDHPAASTLPGVTARLHQCEVLERIERDAFEKLWPDAIARIANSSIYSHLVLTPQPGLVPLGPDPQSRLEEFADVHTGSIPSRNPDDGKLISDPENSVVFVLLPAQDVNLGAQARDPERPNYEADARLDESPVKSIQLDAFFISKYEFSQRQWWNLMGTNPSFRQPGSMRFGKLTTWLDPVESFCFNDAAVALSRMGAEFPTEAQWECAARATTTGNWWCSREELVHAANYADASNTEMFVETDFLLESWNDGYAAACPVDAMKPNLFGLHNMLGNLSEYCEDFYAEDYYTPMEERTGKRFTLLQRMRIIRGGCYQDLATEARCASRSAVFPDMDNQTVGLRPARKLR